MLSEGCFRYFKKYMTDKTINGSVEATIFQFADNAPAKNASNTTGLSIKIPIELRSLFGSFLKAE
ncbi:MAG: hypothetical protein OHK0019_21720 [Saprospiraceae bacterium]